MPWSLPLSLLISLLPLPYRIFSNPLPIEAAGRIFFYKTKIKIELDLEQNITDQ
jgi:hypothetical protein